MATGPANNGGSSSPQKPGTPQAKPAAPSTGSAAARPATTPPAARPLVGPPGSRPPASGVAPTRPPAPATGGGPARPPVTPPKPQSSAQPAAARPAAPVSKPVSGAKPASPAGTGSPAGASTTGIPRLSGVRAPLNPGSTGTRQSAVVPTHSGTAQGPGAPKGRTPSAEQPANNNISNDRAKLGLGQKPSEMIEGLDDYAKRVEKQEEREEAKRKAGGKINQNEALKVDDTGKRWQRNVILGLIGVAVLVGGLFIVAAVRTNMERIDPKIANRNTRDMLTQLIGFAQRLPAGESDASGDRIRDLLREQIDEQLKQVEADIERDQERRKKESKHRPKDTRLYRERETLTELRKFQDPFGQPFTFNVSDGVLTISAKGKPEGGPIEPVSTNLTKAPPKSAEKQ